MSGTIFNKEVVYTSPSPWYDESHRTLVFYCSDPRYREAIDEFLHSQGLELYDQIVMPGGPAIILQSSYTFTNDRARLQMLCKEHGIKRVIGITHRGCRYYTRRYPNLDPEKLWKKEEEDLLLFVQEIKKLAPEVQVEIYLAEVVDQHVQFSRMS